jgi:hypothetical protein
MIHKKILRPDRLRRPPAQFSWVDHRLVREGYLQTCPPEALALYLFLVTVADAQGLSYYSDEKCAGYLSLDAPHLQAARRSLIHTGLIAYKRPLYQVLSLEPASPPRSGKGRAQSFAEILSGIGGGA